MANAPYTPPPRPEAPAAGPSEFDYDNMPGTGVRERGTLAALEEREVQRVRWGAVVAGLFIAMGVQILLGLLGVAVGLTAIDPQAPSPLAGLGLGAGIWMAVASLVALFIGGFAASKLSGSIRRGDGMLAGVLTWATSVVVTIWLLGAGATTAVTGVIDAAQAPGAAPQTRGLIQDLQRDPQAAAQQAEQAARGAADDAARVAWYSLGGVVLSLLAAIVGGAVGSVAPAVPARRDPRRGGGLRDRDDRDRAFRTYDDRSHARTYDDREYRGHDDRERGYRGPDDRDRDVRTVGETQQRHREVDREGMHRDREGIHRESTVVRPREGGGGINRR